MTKGDRRATRPPALFNFPQLCVGHTKVSGPLAGRVAPWRRKRVNHLHEISHKRVVVSCDGRPKVIFETGEKARKPMLKLESRC